MNPAPAWIRFDVAAFWVRDDIEMMTFEEVGLLWYLLGREWLNGPLPDDADLLKRLVRGRVSDWDAAWSVVQRCFERTPDGRLACSWIEDQRAEAERRRRERSESGSRGGKSRQRKAAAAQGLAQAKPEQSYGADRAESELSISQREAPPQRSSSSPQARTDVRKNECTDGTDRVPSTSPPSSGSKSPHVEFREFWCDAFQRSKGAAYAFGDGKDGALVNAILAKAGGDIELAKARALALLNSTDDFIVSKGVDLGTLSAMWNRLASARPNGAAKPGPRLDPAHTRFVPPPQEA